MEVKPAILLPLSPTANRTEVAYHTAKRRIIELDLAPGSQFTEGELAREAGVSKSPVRDALSRLQRDGLVESVPRSGYVVTPITLGATADLSQFRAIVEPAAARLAAKRGLPADHLDRLEALASDVLTKPWGADPDEVEVYLRANFEFDAIIANACGNLQLTRSIVDIFDSLERVLRLVLPSLQWSSRRVDQRSAIVAALRAREAEDSYAASLARAEDSATEVFEALAQSSSLRDVAIGVV